MYRKNYLHTAIEKYCSKQRGQDSFECNYKLTGKRDR